MDACGRLGAQGCPIVTIAITLGTEADPLTVAAFRSLGWWMDIWYRKWPPYPLWLKAWLRIRAELCDAAFKWEAVGGAVGTVIMYLHLLGWQHNAADKWVRILWHLQAQPGPCGR